jgi:hypothetical protein
MSAHNSESHSVTTSITADTQSEKLCAVIDRAYSRERIHYGPSALFIFRQLER